MAASADGTIAVMWYDLTGDKPGDSEVTTNVWVAQHSGSSQRWKIARLGEPFDILKDASAAEQAMGDFQSLVPVGSGFEAAFTMGEPDAQHGYGPTDIFAAAVP